MRHPFVYHRPASREEAASLLANAGAMPLGGGTDLLVLIDEALAEPSALVDLRSVAGMRTIQELPNGGLRVGAGTRIDDLASDSRIRSQYPVLAEACASVGTPALRQMGTIGGNLCQRPRCWYFRRGIPCFKSGGESCPAVDGANQYLAILGGGPCYAVHPSDPAVALVALDGVIEITGAVHTTAPAATRTVPIEQFFSLPTERLDRETNLAPGEFVSAIVVPADSASTDGTMQRYYKTMQRGTWDFALVSLAAVRRRNGDLRLVFGGVAPRPWRVLASVEGDVASGQLDFDALANLAERALYDARPLSDNGYKLDIAVALLRRAVRELTA